MHKHYTQNRKFIKKSTESISLSFDCKLCPFIESIGCFYADENLEALGYSDDFKIYARDGFGVKESGRKFG